MFPKFLRPIEVHSIHELGLGAVFALFYWPIAFMVYSVNVTLRFIAQQILNFRYPGRYTIADGEDSVFGVKLHGSSKSIIHGYKIIRGKPDVEVIRKKTLEIFTKCKGYEKLKHMMVPKNGYFFWDKEVPFDVNRHVRLLDDFDPNEIVDEAKLLKICSNFVGTEVGKGDMPMWELLLIPRYRTSEESENLTETNHYVLITRLHHAYCDGISYVLLVNNFLSDSPGELPIDPTKDFDNPIWIKAYIWAKMFLIGPLNFFKNLAILVLSRSEYRVERYLNSKVLAKSSSIDMDKLREIRKASGTSVTAITISAVYGALHKFHSKLFPGKPIPQNLHLGSIGVMLPYIEEKSLVNQFTMWRYTAPLEVIDPKERLEKTFKVIRMNASQPDPVFNFFMQRALGSLPKFLHEILFNLSGTPIMLSNVPGYKTSVKAFGGEIVDVVAWIPLVTTTGIGLSSQSYCGKIHFSAITDPQIFPNTAAATEFLEEIVHQVDILAEAYKVERQKVPSQVVGNIEKSEGQPNALCELTLNMRNENKDKDANHCNDMQSATEKSVAVTLESKSLTNSTILVVDVDQHCRHRKDLNTGETENRGEGGSSFEKNVEKVIY